MNRSVLYIVLSVMALLCGACGPGMIAKRTSDAVIPAQAQIAVFPFENFSGKERAGQKLTEYFQTLLSGEQSVRLADFPTVSQALRKHRVRSTSMISRELIDTLAQELGIQYFLTGTVLEYREIDNTFLGNVPQISFNARLISCATRQPVWVAVSNRSGDKGEIVFGIGAVRSPDELMRKMTQEAVARIIDLVGRQR